MNAMQTKPKARKTGRRSGPAPLPAVITEHGLEFRHARGLVDMAKDPLDDGFGLGAVVVERDAADPENPIRKVTRAVAVNACARLHARGAISKEQLLAAEKYGELREIEAGGRWVNGERVSGAVAPWLRSNVSEQQSDAIEALRRVHQVIGLQARDLMVLLIVDNLPINAIAVRHGRLDPVTRVKVPADPKVTAGRVLAALDRMVEYWRL